MKRNLLSVALILSLVGSGFVVGCGDRTVRSSESQSRNPITGNTTYREEKVKERPDGSTYKESNKTTVDH